MEKLTNIPLSKKKILSRPIDIYSYANDASFYKFIPKAIVQPESIYEVCNLFKYCLDNKLYMTFRAAGTSLSGQAQTDCLLVDISKHFKRIEFNQEENTIHVGVGLVTGKVNEYLKRFGRKLGPDPASINACMIGGIIANNSSGMSSGTHLNPYSTVQNMIYALPNGLIIDSSDSKSDDLLRNHSNDIYIALQSIRNEIISNEKHINKIKSKYRIKNTIGYSLNSFLDYERPIDILTHLMIGSEGTLGFVSEAEFMTIPDNQFKLTGLLSFPDIKSATQCLIPLKNAGAVAIEIMDRISVRAIETQQGVPTFVKELPEQGSLVLFEFSSSDPKEIKEKRSSIDSIINKLNLFSKPFITEDRAEQASIWRVRQGLLTSVASERKPGNTAVIEDLAFDIEDLSEAFSGLQEIFIKNGYKDTGIYGHGIDGNLHFVLSQSFAKNEDLWQYKKLTEEIAEFTVKKFNGSLKAEHGTGRNMASFVEMEWGSDLYSIIKKIKNLIDPNNILNPGVIINSDKDIHLKNIKISQLIDELVDKCIDCGFCESKCPSKELTLSPRRRIAILREIEKLKIINQSIANQLENDFTYYGIDTCAVDGLCATACPVGINTGELIKKYRFLNNSSKANKLASIISKRFSSVEKTAKFGLNTAHIFEKVLGYKNLNSISKIIEKRFRIKGFPKWNQWITKPAKLIETSRINIDAVYFPCCVTRIFGSDKENNKENLIEVMLDLSKKAGLELFIPPDSSEYCCGMAFSSKGYNQAFSLMINKFIKAINSWTENGKYTLVMDSSSCTYTLKNCYEHLNDENKDIFKKLKILDSIEFANQYLVPGLKLEIQPKTVVLHPNCSVVKMNLQEMLYGIAKSCAKEVVIPVNLGCCGFAGDRGFMFPELTGSATKNEAEEVKKVDTECLYSSNITCEIGMSQSVGKKYKSFLYLIKEAAM